MKSAIFACGLTFSLMFIAFRTQSLSLLVAAELALFYTAAKMFVTGVEVGEQT